MTPHHRGNSDLVCGSSQVVATTEGLIAAPRESTVSRNVPQHVTEHGCEGIGKLYRSALMPGFSGPASPPEIQRREETTNLETYWPLNSDQLDESNTRIHFHSAHHVRARSNLFPSLAHSRARSLEVDVVKCDQATLRHSPPQ